MDKYGPVYPPGHLDNPPSAVATDESKLLTHLKEFKFYLDNLIEDLHKKQAKIYFHIDKIEADLKGPKEEPHDPDL